MKTLNGKILCGAPYSRVRYEDARHICADCLEHKPTAAPAVRYEAFTLPSGKPTCISGACHVCEQRTTVALVRQIEEETTP